MLGIRKICKIYTTNRHNHYKNKQRKQKWGYRLSTLAKNKRQEYKKIHRKITHNDGMYKF